MEKKMYETPEMEEIKIKVEGSLLDNVSQPEEESVGEDGFC